jgi:hypothetical protein
VDIRLIGRSVNGCRRAGPGVESHARRELAIPTDRAGRHAEHVVERAILESEDEHVLDLAGHGELILRHEKPPVKVVDAWYSVTYEP